MKPEELKLAIFSKILDILEMIEDNQREMLEMYKNRPGGGGSGVS